MRQQSKHKKKICLLLKKNKEGIIYRQIDVFENSVFLKIEQCSKNRLKVCLSFYALTTAHFLFLGLYLVTIDYDSFADARLKKYEEMRFRLLTVWANLMHLAYFPYCLIYTWMEYKEKHLTPSLKKLNRFRHFWFTAILFPITVYVDVFFWRVWLVDRELLVPSYCDVMLPWWAQHGLHTNTLIFVIMELLLVPRFRPKDLSYHNKTLNAFCVVYLAVALWTNLIEGYWIYPFLEKLSPLKLQLFGLLFCLESRFFAFAQWILVDMTWGHRMQEEMVKRVKPKEF